MRAARLAGGRRDLQPGDRRRRQHRRHRTVHGQPAPRLVRAARWARVSALRRRGARERGRLVQPQRAPTRPEGAAQSRGDQLLRRSRSPPTAVSLARWSSTRCCAHPSTDLATCSRCFRRQSAEHPAARKHWLRAMGPPARHRRLQRLHLRPTDLRPRHRAVTFRLRSGAAVARFASLSRGRCGVAEFSARFDPFERGMALAQSGVRGGHHELRSPRKDADHNHHPGDLGAERCCSLRTGR